MKPIYSRQINVQLMPYNTHRNEWVLAFYDVEQDFTMMYICEEEELLTLADDIRENLLESIRMRKDDD